jgi:hypothetical protein
MASALNYLQGVSADDVLNGSALIKLEFLLDKHDVEKLKPVLSYFRRNDRASLIKITPVLKKIFNPLRAAASARNCTKNTHVAVTNPTEYDAMFRALDLSKQRDALYELPKSVISAVQTHNGSAAALFVTMTKGASVTTTRGMLGAGGMNQAMRGEDSVVMQKVQKMAQNSTVQGVRGAVNSAAGMGEAMRGKDSVVMQKVQKMAQNSTVQGVRGAVNSAAGMKQAMRGEDSVVNAEGTEDGAEQHGAGGQQSSELNEGHVRRSCNRWPGAQRNEKTACRRRHRCSS